MKSLLFILNPRAGMRKANRALADIFSVFNRAGYRTELYVTGKRGDATEAARQRAGEVDLVVCCGGDGTFNEVLSGLMESGVHTPLGYIPAGSTNDFANSLKLPTSMVSAAQRIVESQVRRFDVGRFGDRYFSYVASFGMFTKTSYATSQDAKNALGHLAYLLGGISELSQLRPIHVKMELDSGEVLEDDYIFGAVCNSTSVGGIISLDPSQVDMSDGLFEVFLLKMPKDLIQLNECIRAVQKQQYNSCQAITFRTVSRAVITMDPKYSWTLDGEMAPGAPTVTIENLPQAMHLQG